MTARPKYAVGIDLGTSNCALSYVHLRRDPETSHVLQIPQWESAVRDVLLPSLPSFAYYPMKESAVYSLVSTEKNGQIIGILARDHSVQEPERVISSAKSWLAHSGIDRRVRTLPWRSDEIDQENKLSPVEASALYLNHLLWTWNETMAETDRHAALKRQHVVITVPASFDQAAQQLTLEAARLAGYPDSIRLLEEPQAAFHAWAERHPEPDALRKELGIPADDTRPRHVLVCDIGGGTTDFSIFTIEMEGGGARINRSAVSDHILLGGDNMDLAIAAMLERKIVGPDGKLSSHAWQSLVNESRRLKENVLAGLGPNREVGEDTVLRVGVSETGGSLFASAKTAEIRFSELVSLIEDGFFPLCHKDDRPVEQSTGLHEMGLPYAKDTAVTRYLAEFLSEREPVDAVLFNGGAVTPEYLRTRMRDLIGYWQDGHIPVALENRELDLAVARGAAMFGRTIALNRRPLITAGSAHGFYIQAASQQGAQGKAYLVCLIPKGTEVGRVQMIDNVDLHLLVNRPIEFKIFYSARREGDYAGQVIRFDPYDFHELPPMQTVVRIDESSAETFDSETVSVALEAELNSLGLLVVSAVSTEKRFETPQRWNLQFNMRAVGEPEEKGSEASAEESEKKDLPDEIKQEVAGILTTPFGPGVLREMEKAIGKKRQSWSLQWLRSFWEPLYTRMSHRDHSPEHETAWLNAAGFILRPGYGVAFDDFRMDQVWNLQALELSFPKVKAVREQYFVLWRRLAGGLTETRQKELYRDVRTLIASHVKQGHEAVRMAGALERLTSGDKRDLLGLLLEGLDRTPEKRADAYVWALGRVLSRVPLYAGDEAVLPPGDVAEAFEHLRHLDWTSSGYARLNWAFAGACRLRERRALDVLPDVRNAIVDKLRASGADDELIRPVLEHIPVARNDYDLLFGESLPVGLSIHQF